MRTTFPIALLLCTVFLQGPDAHAQKVPTVKVEKKKKKVERPKARKNPKKIRDRYKRPASKRVKYDNAPGNENRLSSPNPEEGQPTERLSIWQRIFNRNKPTRFAGKRKYETVEQADGTEHVGKDKRTKINHEQISEERHQYRGKIRQASPKQVDKQFGYKAEHMSFYKGGGKVLKPERRDKKLESRSSDLQQAGLYKKKKSNRHEQMSTVVHQYPGNIRQLPPKQVKKQFGYKAEHMSFYRGKMKVLKPDREDKRLNGLSSDMQKTGLYKVRKEKEKAASYTTYRGKLKLPTLKARTRHFEKLSAKVHQYDGDIRYRKPGKDMHPSVFYLKSKTKNSYEQKEKYRRWRLVLMHIFDKQEHPKHLKEKKRKPRYDKDESEIWYY